MVRTNGPDIVMDGCTSLEVEDNICNLLLKRLYFLKIILTFLFDDFFFPQGNFLLCIKLK
jgi:hypothetical protein